MLSEKLGKSFEENSGKREKYKIRMKNKQERDRRYKRVRAQKDGTRIWSCVEKLFLRDISKNDANGTIKYLVALPKDNGHFSKAYYYHCSPNGDWKRLFWGWVLNSKELRENLESKAIKNGINFEKSDEFGNMSFDYSYEKKDTKQECQMK